MTMRVLLTNSFLRQRSGSELYVYDLALALQRRDHEPVVFAPLLGELADELRGRGVRVVDDLAGLRVRPDVMHLQHTAEAAAALVRFPGAPAIRVYHDAWHWCDEPVLLPGISLHIAVDLAVRDRALHAGVPADLLRVIGNGVDLERFAPRGPLPTVPGRLLVFSNTTTEANYLPAVRRACAMLGLSCDAAGMGVGAVEREPEKRLRDYDVVVAKARCAREAIAVGCAVLAADAGGLAGLVTDETYSRLDSLNFGRRALGRPVTAELVAEELALYDAADAAKVSARLRADGGLDVMVDRLLDAYTDASGNGSRPLSADQGNECPSSAALASAVQLAGARGHRLDEAAAERARLHELVAALRDEASERDAAIGALRTESEALLKELATLQAAVAERDAEMAALRAAAADRDDDHAASLLEAHALRDAAAAAATAAESSRRNLQELLDATWSTRTWRAHQRLGPVLGWLLAKRGRR